MNKQTQNTIKKNKEHLERLLVYMATVPREKPNEYIIKKAKECVEIFYEQSLLPNYITKKQAQQERKKFVDELKRYIEKNDKENFDRVNKPNGGLIRPGEPYTILIFPLFNSYIDAFVEQYKQQSQEDKE